MIPPYVDVDDPPEYPGNDGKEARRVTVFIQNIVSTFNLILNLNCVTQDVFPIRKEIIDKLKDTPHKFILDLMHGLYSTKFLRKHKTTNAKTTNGDSYKVAMNQTEKD